MKKIILAVSAVFVFGFANAQDKKVAKSGEGFQDGDVFITGAVGVGTTNDKNSNVKTNDFVITPQVALFVSENIAVGIKVGYSSSTTKNPSTTTSDETGFLAGAFARYYFTPTNKFSLFGQVGYDYGSLTDNLALPNKVKTNTNNFNLGLGLNYFVANNFSLETGLALLNFGSSKSDVSGDNGKNSFSIGSEFRVVTFGVNYRF